MAERGELGAVSSADDRRPRRRSHYHGERAMVLREQQSQLEGDAEHPLSHGNFGKDAIR
jgi:hypothetical protein